MTALTLGRSSLGLAASLLFVTASPALAAPVETPEAFVRRVYARYGNEGPGVFMTRPEGTPFYTAGLLDAVAKDSAGGAGSIDWDPICDCQDYEKLRLKNVAISEGESDTVLARVAFTNLGSRHTVLLTMSRTPAGWRIADVGGKGTKSVMALLKQANAHSGQPKP